jgi:IS5 family transposase
MVYRFSSGQISVTDFGMPLGMKLSPENRWVKKAETIPWEEIEGKYAALFKNRNGNVAKPLRMALGALIVQTERMTSDVETVYQIQETPCLQYFCGNAAYEDKLPFDPSLMVYFRKRLTPEILGEINEMIIAKARCKENLLSNDENQENTTPSSPDDSNNNPPPVSGDSGNMPLTPDATVHEPSAGPLSEAPVKPSNSGTLIVDATCAPQNIRYPFDLSLLNEGRENLEHLIDKLHNPACDGEKPRTYRQRARRDYLKTSKKRQKTNEELRSAIKKQLQYVRRDLDIVSRQLESGKDLSYNDVMRLGTVEDLYEQQLSMYNARTHNIEDRIVSISQPWVRPIVRGKARAKCEFGAKLDISVSDGFVRLEHTSFDAYNEGENLKEVIERYRAREGHYPERVLADSIYRTQENIKFCKEHSTRLSGKPLGRPKTGDKTNKKIIRQDDADRVAVEREFSYAKGSFGLGRIRSKLRETSRTAIALTIMALNIAYIGRILREFSTKDYFDLFFSQIFNVFKIREKSTYCSVGIN